MPRGVKAAPAEDRALLAAVAAGDEAAFDRLYARYSTPLFNYLLSLVGERAVAEELLQETFLGLWQGAGRFRGRSSVRTWLYRIAHHKAVDCLRRRRPQVTLESLLLPSSEDGPEEAAERTLRAEAVRRALAELSPEQRAVVELTFVHGFSYREIAGVLDCPVGTVKSRMRHALRYLKASLNGALE